MTRGKIAMAIGVFAFAVLAQTRRFDETALDFVHQPSKTASKFLLESVAGGVAMLDYDGDGLLDLYFVNGAALRDDMSKGSMPDKREPKYANRLYRNLGGGRFEDVTDRAGVRGAYYGMGVAAADFDNDGDTDLYVAGFGGNQLFRNDGGKFTDITEAAGVRGVGWSSAAAWVDVDHDGLLDLAVARYLQWDFDPSLWCGARKAGHRSYCNPDRFPPAAHLLFKNLGNGRFRDVSDASGFGKAPGRGLGIAIADYDLDGRIDIAVANDAAPQQLFHNLGGGRFAEVGFDANIAYDDDGRTFSGMGIDFDDWNDDGRPDLLINALAAQRYALFRNTPAGFEYVSGPAGIARLTRNHSGWGMRFVDVDNDGRKDIVVAQSHVMDNIQVTQPAVAYEEQMLLLRNTGAGFTAESFGPARAYRGAAFGDLDNDGSVDVATVAQLAPAMIFNGRKNANHWLIIKLEGAASNRDGIGARVRVNGHYRTVTTASSYFASNDPRVHFGLGSATKAEIEIWWPSGKRQTVTAASADRVLTIREP